MRLVSKATGLWVFKQLVAWFSDDAQSETNPKSKRTKHSKYRDTQNNRRGQQAFNDAQQARREDVFIDTENDTWVVRSKKGREQIFNFDGKHVTAINRPNQAHKNRLKTGRIKPISDDEWQKFKETFQ